MKAKVILQCGFMFAQLFGGLNVAGQSVLTLPQLKEDFQLFRTALEEAHPGIYRYEDKSVLDDSFNVVAKALAGPLTQQEFYKKLNPIVAKIGCGHTKLMPSEDNGFIYYYNTENLFPLKLFLEGHKAYVLSSYDSSIKIKPGTEIIAINGMAIKDIINGLLNNLFSDGHNQSFKYYELNRYFSALFSNFYLEEGKGQDKISITYMDHRRNGIMDLPVVSYQRIKEIDDEEMNEIPYQLEFKDGNTALLTLRTFWPNDEKYNFEGFLKQSFATINDKNIQNLILDLRGNEGGKDGYGTLLLSYLMDTEFRYYDKLVLATNERFSFMEHAQLPEGYDQLRSLITQTEDGEFRWEHNENLHIQIPQENRFTGEVFVLIDGACFSVTSEFSAVAHYLHRATFIGDETGGGYYGNNSGAFAIVTLPNSKLKLGIPLMAYYTAVKDYEFIDRGIVPHYQVQPTITGVLLGRDEVMEKVVAIIGER
ncbi:S41 family peptidase [Arenibacter sp. F26102]|uniref:S41 family peptidase n=1 Tax=Arenibacter sp. F26102 TaxID=2926416 RepID=UPI001FF54F43|nr:S41 family peptidase [Arenibacter sp. F26102]MCK0147105.1 S41 family peptidase [Arenibacter sp. F26102]